MPSLEELHAQADALWRSIQPDDPAAEMYTEAVTSLHAGESVTQRRATKWITTLHRNEDHWWATGHTPRENTRARSTLADEDRTLGEWARCQRRFEDQPNSYQRARLGMTARPLRGHLP